ncbi:MAG: stage II sporulation protein P [Ruminococcus sp.]|nr:stage II sporulation protein P [Candidatus Apopatosoma intestinale]
MWEPTEEVRGPYIKERKRRGKSFFRVVFLLFLVAALTALVLLFRNPGKKLAWLSLLLRKEPTATQDTKASADSHTETTESTETESPPPELSVRRVDYSAKALGVRYENRTSYEIDNAYFVSSASFAPGGVLVFATRGYEAYAESGDGIAGEENVASLAETLADALRKEGVNAVFLPVSENGVFTYENSCRMVSEYLAGHSEIAYVIDLSREVLSDEGDYLCPVTVKDGQTLAQFRFAVGTDEGGGVHPDWRARLSDADTLYSLCNGYCDTLLMPTLISTARLNQHLPCRAFTLKVGAFGNRYAEAEATVRLFARLFAAVITT